MYHKRSLRGAVGAPTQESELEEKESYTDSSPGEQGAAIARRRVADALIKALAENTSAAVVEAAEAALVYLTSRERTLVFTAAAMAMRPATDCAIINELYPDDAGAGIPTPAFDDVAAEAADWADWASLDELRAYAAASSGRLPEGDRRKLATVLRRRSA